jgi:hypothetical protein
LVTRYYPDGRRPFNLADYMKGKPKPRNDDLTYYNDFKYYKYYTGNTNKDGTPEVIPIVKKGEQILYTNNEVVKTPTPTPTSPTTKSKGLTLADLTGQNKPKVYL